jgi:methionyl-tRNA synthetase
MEHILPSFYVTTPLYYVNDKPHIGHAYTTIAADVLARWHKMNGRETHFLTGTDEHGQKVFRVSQKRGMSPKEHADDMVQPFKELWSRLDIGYDDFIRTTEARHTRVVQAVLNRIHAQGDIYAKDYEGWYSTSEERFWTEKDLVDGKCPLSGKPVEWLKERNYFFKMSSYADQLRTWIEENPGCIQPESRKNEVLGYLRKEVGDLCISRPKTRLPWGIPLPFDDDFVTYVWFDALLNYVTALGYSPEGESSELFRKHWPADVQLLGKDILTTHSVFWSTMLFALGQRPANLLFAHGWWTVEGRKMGKSMGNAVDPGLLIDNYGADAVRFFLLREIPFGGDGNFSHDGFMVRYNADLANDFGNLLHRALSMTHKWLGPTVPALGQPTEEDGMLEEAAQKTLVEYTQQIESLQFYQAMETLWNFVRLGNKYIDRQKPWQLNREGDMERLGGVMRRCLEVCRIAAKLFSPVMPSKAGEVAELLGGGNGALDRLDGLQAGGPLGLGEPLFPRMKELPESILKARAAALGEPLETKQPTKTKTQGRIKLKVFQRVPFLSGRILEASEKNSLLSIKVDVGGESPMEFIDAPLGGEPPGTLVGKDVAIARPASRSDFGKIQLRTGQITAAKVHPEAEKLLVLTVELGEQESRTIVAGIANRFSPADLAGQKVTVVANLKPSKLRGIVSQGMLLAAGGERLQSLVVSPQEKTGEAVDLFGGSEEGILCIGGDEQGRLMALSGNTEPGSIIR